MLSNALRRLNWRVCCCIALLVPHAVIPQAFAYESPTINNLPSLGDPASQELTPFVEYRIGQKIFAEAILTNQISDDPIVTAYLRNLLERLKVSPLTASHKFEIFLMDDQVVNAFALPGGYIGINAGLIQFMQTESELAAVVAHEMGHVVQRHIARGLIKEKQTAWLSLLGLMLAVAASTQNPNAGVGTGALADALQAHMMLSFSRDFEREADRIGFQILQASAFDVNDMANIYIRLMTASRFESDVSPFSRSHPLNTERMADIQNRLQNIPYKQYLDHIDFHLVRSRLSVMAAKDSASLFAIKKRLEQILQEKRTRVEASAWYGLALTQSRLKNWSEALQALQEARKSLKKSNVLDQLEIEIQLNQRKFKEAVKLAKQALEKFPNDRPIRYQYVQALQSLGQDAEASKFIETQLKIDSDDLPLYVLLGQSYATLRKGSLASKSAALRFLKLGEYKSALEQLENAKRENDGDFYQMSEIEAKLREVKRLVEDDKKRK